MLAEGVHDRITPYFAHQDRDDLGLIGMFYTFVIANDEFAQIYMQIFPEDRLDRRVAKSRQFKEQQEQEKTRVSKERREVLPCEPPSRRPLACVRQYWMAKYG